MGQHVNSSDPAKALAVKALKEATGGTKVTMVTRELDGTYEGDVMRPAKGGGFERMGRFSVTLDVAPAEVAEEDQQASDEADGKYPRVGMDAQGHVALILSAERGVVRFIPMDPSGLSVRRMAEKSVTKVIDGVEVVVKMGIDFAYPPLEDYDPRMAARLFVRSGQDFGINNEAREELERLTPLTDAEIQRIVEVQQRRSARFALIKRKGAVMADPKTAGGAAKEAAAPKEKRRTAAGVFQELIMAGGQTDDEIFAAVKEEFQLEDSKRGYVAWYRNFLRKKKGLSPPDPIVSEEPEVAPTPAAAAAPVKAKPTAPTKPTKPTAPAARPVAPKRR